MDCRDYHSQTHGGLGSKAGCGIGSILVHSIGQRASLSNATSVEQDSTTVLVNGEVSYNLAEWQIDSGGSSILLHGLRQPPPTARRSKLGRR